MDKMDQEFSPSTNHNGQNSTCQSTEFEKVDPERMTLDQFFQFSHANYFAFMHDPSYVVPEQKERTSIKKVLNEGMINIRRERKSEKQK